MPEEHFSTASTDTRCKVCRRAIFPDDKSMTWMHWDPRIDKDHQAEIELRDELRPVIEQRRWYQNEQQ